MCRTALLFLLALPVAAWGQASPPQHPGGQSASPARRMMTEMDADKDGYVSRDEFMAAHARADAMFEQLDGNHDGAISRDEFLAGGRGGQGRGERFRLLDSNNDGRITREELEARHTARFEALDADRDGKLSPQELRAGQNAMRRDALDPSAR